MVFPGHRCRTSVLSFLRPKPATAPGLTWWTTHSLEKVHPSDPEPATPAHNASIHAARNEFEPFQLVLRSVGQDLDAVDIEVSDLQGKSAAIRADKYVTVYFEGFLNLTHPSSVAGGTGEWPDPLIPRVDRYANEKRNAFPFKLVDGRTQPIWIDVFVPPATPAGMYHGEVRVTVGEKTRITVPVELEVWDFELPSTSTLPTIFGFSGNAAERTHYGRYKADKDVDEITYVYAKSALWHRVTLDGSASVLPIIKIADGNVHLQWSEYDSLMEPFMAGRVFLPGEPLSGAKATSVAVHTPPLIKTPEQQVQFWRQVAQHFREKGWFDRLINYLWDEPKANSYPAMAELGRTVHQADPRVAKSRHGAFASGLVRLYRRLDAANQLLRAEGTSLRFLQSHGRTDRIPARTGQRQATLVVSGLWQSRLQRHRRRVLQRLAQLYDRRRAGPKPDHGMALMEVRHAGRAVLQHGRSIRP